MPQWLRRVYARLRYRDFQRDVAQEIDAHRAMKQADLEAAGLSTATARDRTARELGNVTLMREHSRAIWLEPWLEQVWQDGVGSLAFLFRQRGYLTLSLATLVLAVGANLVVFTIVNALWLRPRPVKDPSHVVMVMGEQGSTGSSENFWFAELGLQHQVRDVPAFALVAGQVMTSGFNAALTPKVVLDAVGHSVETLGVTSEYLSVLGLAIHGRDFVRDDDRYSSAPVAIISDRLWRTAFGGRPDVIGQVLAATPLPVQIIGVAPPGFQGARLGEQADLWVPRNLVPRVSAVPTIAGGIPGVEEGAAGMLAIARLQPWVSVAEAQRLIDRQEFANPRTRLVVVPLSAVFGSPDHRTLLINEGPVLQVIAATALLVLIGGCATLMALVLVHYERRRQEFAIRLAIGASQGRLVRRLAAELAWLVALGCGGAVLIATWSMGALPALNLPGGVNLGRLDFGFDWRMGVAALGASAITMGVAACLPLLRFTTGGLARSLISPTGTANAGSLRIRKVMLGIHVAATVVVLVAASLFVRTVAYGFAGGAGFDVDRTLFVSVDVGTPFDLSAAMTAERASGRTPTSSAQARQEAAQLSDELRQRRQARSSRVLSALRALPAIDVVAVGPTPIGVDQAANIAQPKFVAIDAGERSVRLGSATVSPAYSSALGLRVIAGRTLTEADVRPQGAPVPVLVTASLAGDLWPGTSPLGRHAHVGFSAPGTDYEVVGVVADFAFGSLRFDSPATMLTTARGDAPGGNTLSVVLRTRDPQALAESLRRQIEDLVPGAPRLVMSTGRDLVAADLGRERLGAWFFSGFGLVAVGLGVGGVFGLVAYLAESRRREFGVRIALGATSSNLVRMALTAGLLPSALGAGVGLIGAVWLGRAAESFLIGVSRFDALSYALGPVLMLAVATAAGLAAAWRVHRLSPLEALRSE